MLFRSHPEALATPWGGISLEDPRAVSMGLTDMGLPGEDVAVELSETLGNLPDLPPAITGLSRAMRAGSANDFRFTVFLIERKESKHFP